MVDATTPELFFHGRYHVRYTARRGRTLVGGLAGDAAAPVDNMALINLTSPGHARHVSLAGRARNAPQV